jgi:hypothetical protein
MWQFNKSKTILEVCDMWHCGPTIIGMILAPPKREAHMWKKIAFRIYGKKFTNLTPYSESIIFWLPIIKPIITPSNPLKNCSIYGSLSHNVTSENNHGNFVGWFFLDWCHNWRHHFLWVCWSHFTFSDRDSTFFGPLLKKKRELPGTRFINKACIIYKRLLGTSGVR